MSDCTMSIEDNMERKRGIIFDMDGVLVDAMPFHCEAIKTAARQEVDIDVEQRDVYLLKECPGKTWSSSCSERRDTLVI